MKITRREWAGTLAAGAMGAAAPAEETPDELLKQVREDLRRSVAAIARTPLPMDAEPAFQFRAQ